jgi:hypothetical protein
MKWIFLFFSVFSIVSMQAQISPGVYHAQDSINGLSLTHELKIDNTYFIHTIYTESPPGFVKTVGGFYKLENDVLTVKLEFNSNYEEDTTTSVELPIEIVEDGLVLIGDNNLNFKKDPDFKQPLDGKWLFATRGPDEGQERRGESNSRKTMKFLSDGYFQWIAYDTETFKFSGTGGGTYTSKDGVYSENIQFFSRDNARVGAQLNFTFEIKGDDWHHKGKNSKGGPMYEIWAVRK